MCLHLQYQCVLIKTHSKCLDPEPQGGVCPPGGASHPAWGSVSRPEEKQSFSAFIAWTADGQWGEETVSQPSTLRM